MLNGQLKPFATTSPRPLIRGSSDFYSLYSASAGGPIVCGVLEDCTDCNLGSFISAGLEGGLILKPPPSPLWALVKLLRLVADLEQQELSTRVLALFWPDRTDDPFIAYRES